MFDCDGPQTAEEHAAESAAWRNRQSSERAGKYKELLVGIINVFRIRGKIESSDIDRLSRLLKQVG